MDLDTPIQYLKGVGEKRARLLAKLGVFDIRSLLSLFPRSYEDWGTITPIAEALPDIPCCVKAIVRRNPTTHLIRKGMTLYKTEVTDGDTLLTITIFNNKYAAEKLIQGEEYLFFGKITYSLFGREMLAPDIEIPGLKQRIRPIYPQTAGLNSKALEKLMETALEKTADSIPETLPAATLAKYNLEGKTRAIRDIHFPPDFESLERAKNRLIFEELLLLQLGLMMTRGKNRNAKATAIKKDYSEDFFSLLPFKPTSAQRRAVEEAVEDMAKPHPMNRLLQGDVGSGKTAVAAALIYNCALNGLQSALMAPTEILARQHYRTFSKLFKGTDLQPALLVGATPAAEKRRIKEGLENGTIRFVTGTHALIQKDVEFENLGLAVTDEQHRFGVVQRARLGEKGHNPHVLVMSATPIPRTMNLIVFGDLDVSVLDELPPGRQPVETYAVDSGKRDRVFNYVKKHLNEGRQGYIVCPLVEEGETELIAAKEYAEKLASGAFKGYTVGLMHGKLKAKEKDSVMTAFAEGEIQLLVSTTVVEVGVDVPNAVIMVIENAERFGLSQLHQLRGRIGRGAHRSTCILISDAQNEEAADRMRIITGTADGFKIADEDLRLRGPGDFFSARQHGLPEMKIADMLNDKAALVVALKAAKEIVEKDRGLELPENKALKTAVNQLFKTVSPSGMN